MNYEAHIRSLAAELGVEVKPLAEDARSRGYASYDVLKDRYVAIEIKRLDTEEFYAVALHELGHVATTDISRGTELRSFYSNPLRQALSCPLVELEAEAEASLWALEHAAIPLSGEGRQSLLHGIESYSRSATPGTLARATSYQRLRAELALAEHVPTLSLGSDRYAGHPDPETIPMPYGYYDDEPAWAPTGCIVCDEEIEPGRLALGALTCAMHARH